MYRIEAPEAVAPKGGLLTAVPATSGMKPFALMEGAIYDENLISPPRPVPGTGEEKQFDQIGTGTAGPVTVYRGIDASILDDKERAQTVLENSFTQGVTLAVESFIQDTILNEGTVLSIETITNLRQATGILEQWAAENFSALPLLHGNRLAVSMMRDLQVEGEKLFTKQGTPIANGGGYGATGPGEEQVGDGEAWLYVSAYPVIYSGEKHYTNGYSLKENRDLTLIEQSFLPVFQGPVAAVKVGG